MSNSKQQADEALTPKEVANLLRCSHSQVRALISQGRLPHVQISPRKILIYRARLDEFIARREHGVDAALKADAEVRAKVAGLYR